MNIRSQILCLLLLFLSLTLFSIAQDSTQSKAFDGFDSFVTRVMQKLNIPGLAVAVVKDGTIIYKQGYGYSELENKSPVTTKTLFAIGSATKAFTATTVAMLVDQGKLNWDTPVREYLEDFRLNDEYATQNMTPRDLLAHNSGLPRYDLIWYGASLTRRQLYERLQHLQPNKSFRYSFEYQNLMFMTAGYLVERVSGEKWEIFVHRNIIEPLGMRSTVLNAIDAQKNIDCAEPYIDRDEELQKVAHRNLPSLGPAGSIYSNVEDMALWIQFNLDQGKLGDVALVTEASMKKMHTIQTAISAYPPSNIHSSLLYGIGYGMGWFIDYYRGHYVYHHGGAIDGFIATVFIAPFDNFGVVVLSNKGGQMGPAIISKNVADRVFGLEPVDLLNPYFEQVNDTTAANDKWMADFLAKKIEGTDPDFYPENLAGRYRHEVFGDIIIENNNGSLHLTYNGVDFDIHHYHFNMYYFEAGAGQDPLISFHTGRDGALKSVSLAIEPRVDAIEFERVK